MLFGASSYAKAIEGAEETGLLVVMTRGAHGAVVLTPHGPRRSRLRRWRACRR